MEADAITSGKGRLRSVQLRVGTPDSPAPAGTPVRYELERHACRFGVNIHHWGLLPAALQSSLEEAVAGLANAATVPFYWGQSAYKRLPPYEPEPGRTDRDRLQSMARWAVDRGVRVKGHPLVFYREPPWLATLSSEQQEQAYADRVRREVAGFAGLIDSWEVVNEPTSWLQTCGPAGASALDAWNRRSGPVGIIRRAHESARSANPRAELILNECKEDDAFRGIVRRCLDLGVPIDGIGIQHHAIEGPAAPERLLAMLDSFAAFGLPLHVTEIMIPSGSDGLRRSFTWQDRPAWVTTPEGEERQAREAVDLYRRLFAHPAVTDAAGQARIEGFAGVYAVEAEHGGSRLSGRVTLPDRPAPCRWNGQFAALPEPRRRKTLTPGAPSLI